MYDNPYFRELWALVASLAGAITALSSRPFKKMSAIEIVMALVVGASFAFFVGPWIAARLFGAGPVDIRVLGGLYYLLASGSNILIPMAIRKLSRWLGEQEEQKP
jgi:CHASE2 domain-containing sensor protein